MLEGRIFLVTAAIVAGVAAWTDFRTGHIPNRLTLGVLALGPLGHGIAGVLRHESLHDVLVRVGFSLLGVLCAVIPLLLFRSGTLGGGDVKIMAALGALCGFEIGLDIVLHSFLVGALMAVAMFAYKGKLWTLTKSVGRTITNAFRPKAKRKPVASEALSWFRLGPAIFVATAFELLLRWNEAS